MRRDLFFDKKSVHINLTKESHAALREKLFRHDLTMQDLFQGLADFILSDSPKATRLLEGIVLKKIKASLEPKLRSGQRIISELDTDTLYNLIEEDERSETTAAEE